MGFLDKMRGLGSGAITLEVSVDPAVAAPGDEVTVRFDLGGEIDDKCQNVLVRLVGTGSYATEELAQDHEGNVNGTEEVHHLFELHAEEQSHPVKPGANHATFTVPHDAPPTSGVCTWEASVAVERKLAADKSETVELRVRRGPEGLPAERAPRRVQDGLALDDVPVTVRAGDTVSGLLTVAVDSDLSVTAVRIRLHEIVTWVRNGSLSEHGVFEDVPLREVDFSSDSTRITEDRLSAELDLSGAREFRAGTTEQFPFELAVPEDAGPTSGHRHARVQLRLEAWLIGSMHDDLSVDIPLIVH